MLHVLGDIAAIALTAVIYVPGFVIVWGRVYRRFAPGSAFLALVLATIAGLYWPFIAVVYAIWWVVSIGSRRQMYRDALARQQWDEELPKREETESAAQRRQDKASEIRRVDAESRGASLREREANRLSLFDEPDQA